jgi:hypothetical protein
MGKFRTGGTLNIPDAVNNNTRPGNATPAKPPPPPSPSSSTSSQHNSASPSSSSPNPSSISPSSSNSPQPSPNPNASTSSAVDPQQSAAPNAALPPGIPVSHIVSSQSSSVPSPDSGGARLSGSWSIGPLGGGSATIFHGSSSTGAAALNPNSSSNSNSNSNSDPNSNSNSNSDPDPDPDPHGPQAGQHRMPDGRRRENAFYKDGTENENPFPVIYNPNVPNSSAGWSNQQFFADLGQKHPDTDPYGRLKQNAEQEYILQGMPKGALLEASQIATKYNMGIAVRPTGVAAHQGIESGLPTKAQEFKNKTSKEMDLWLCDEMTFGDVGAVMHYDPRVGWKSSDPTWKLPPKETKHPVWADWFEAEWAKKRAYIETVRKPQLKSEIAAGRVKYPQTEEDWGKIKDWFKSRLNEYREEHPEYTSEHGHYKEHVQLTGPFIHLKLRPDEHMYGDHDLFGFTDASSHAFVHDSQGNGPKAQEDLQNADTFQAQHGGIWNWQPGQAFHVGIKNKIMGAHSAPNGEPLIYILPGGKVIAGFYEKGSEKVVPVWEAPNATKWLDSTYSGKEYKQTLPPPPTANK